MATSKKKINLSEYTIGVTLGTGSFGRVKLCKNKKTGEFSALKILKKHDIIKLKQVDHVISENTILIDIDHPFRNCLLIYSCWIERIHTRRQVFVFLARVH